MAIETWAFNIFTSGATTEPEALTAELCQQVYDKYLDLCPRLEAWGLDGVFFAEHHFSTMYVNPSPHLLVAAAAARTSTLRLGVLGSVLPLHDGRRYAEECGMLEYITRGRFEPGIGPGAGDAESVLAGVPADQIRPRYHSAAQLLQKARIAPDVTHQDQFYNLDNVPLIPRMKQDSPRPVWVTVMSASSARWAAERGWRICTAWLPQPVAVELADAYRQTAEAVGHDASPNMLGLRRRVFIAPTDSEAQEIAAEAIDLVTLGLNSQGSKFETADPQVAAMMSHPDDFIVGSPETVAERVIEQCREGGYGTFATWMDYAAFSWDDIYRSYELFGTRVAPILRSTSLAHTSA